MVIQGFVDYRNENSDINLFLFQMKAAYLYFGNKCKLAFISLYLLRKYKDKVAVNSVLKLFKIMFYFHTNLN